MLKIKIPGRYKMIARDSIGLLFADLIYRFSNVAIVWLIAHYLGPTSTGIYTLGSTFRATLQIATLAGTGYLIVRELSRGQAVPQEYLLNFMGMRLGLSLGCWLVLPLVRSFFSSLDSRADLIISVLGLELVPESIREIVRSSFIAQRRVSLYAIIASFTGLARIAACWGILGVGGSLLEAVVFVTFVSWVGNWLGFLKLFSAFHSSWTKMLSFATMKTQFLASIPFLTINTLLTMYAQSSVYLLSLLSTMEELAFYSISDSIVASSSLVTQVYLSLAIPAFSRLNAGDERFKAMYSRSLLVLTSLAFPIAAVTSFQANVVASLWGEQFRSAAPVVSLLIWSLVISWLNAPNSAIMIAAGKERISARFLALALCINLFAGFILIPSRGAIGATVARLTAELAFVSAQWLFVRKKVSKAPIGVLAFPVMAVIVMGFTRFLLDRAIRTWEAVCVSLIMYAIVLLLGLFFSRR